MLNDSHRISPKVLWEDSERRDSCDAVSRTASRREKKAQEMSRSNSVASAVSEAPSMDASAAGLKRRNE